LPALIADIAYQNKRVIYDLLRHEPPIAERGRAHRLHRTSGRHLRRSNGTVEPQETVLRCLLEKSTVDEPQRGRSAARSACHLNHARMR